MEQPTARTLPQYRHWRVSADIDNIQWWYLDRAGEKINALSREVLEELEQLIIAAEQQTPHGIAILSGKPGGFIYGADVREFEGFDSIDAVHAGISRVHDMFNRLAALPCTTVAAIDGYCLGGGLELALACNYRIARDIKATRLGFPEVQLGIFPGFGGSARSVSQLGGLKAMELMLSARQLSARAARAAGLVDEVITRHQALNWAARRAILGQRRSRGPGLLAKLSNIGPVRSLLATQMRKRTAAKARQAHYPAPYRLIDTWQQFGGQPQQMMQAEARAVAELMLSPAAVGLRHVFALMEKLKAQGKRSEFRARAVHVIGAGVMGGDIAAWCALRGLDVSLQDRDIKTVEAAQQRAEKLFRKKLRGDRQKINAARQRLRADVDGASVFRADIVIEAIFENAEAKQQLFRDIEPQLKPDAILATNTSAIPLETLAEVLAEPQRLIGLHFFNPVASMPLVEVVAGRDSTSDALDKGAAFCGQINRFPLQVRSSPGFLVNRVLAPYMMEALRMHIEGLPAEAIDAAAEAFGMPMGPVELADTVGLDVCLMVSQVLSDDAGAAAANSNNKTANFIRERVEAGKLGKKSGEGIYQWQQDKAQKQANKHQGHDLSAIAERLISAYTAECRAALADGIVADEDLLDAGMVFGTGFAPFRGGPMFYLKHRDSQYRVSSPANASTGN